MHLLCGNKFFKKLYAIIEIAFIDIWVGFNGFELEVSVQINFWTEIAISFRVTIEGSVWNGLLGI